MNLKKFFILSSLIISFYFYSSPAMASVHNTCLSGDEEIKFNSKKTDVTNIFSALKEINGKISNSLEGTKLNSLDDEKIFQLAKERKQYLLTLMKNDPQSALKFVLDSNKRDLLQKITTNCVEKLETFKGWWAEIILDDFENKTSKTVYSLSVSGPGFFKLFPVVEGSFVLEPNSEVQIKGFVLDKNIVFDATKKIARQSKEDNSTGLDIISAPKNGAITGATTVNFVPVALERGGDISGKVDYPKYSYIPGGDLSSFYKTASYGQYIIYTNSYRSGVQSSGYCPDAAMPYNISQRLLEHGYLRSGIINRFVAIVPNYYSDRYGGCEIRGVSYLGVVKVSGIYDLTLSIVVDDYLNNGHTLKHEFGHQLGVNHAHSFFCRNGEWFNLLYPPPPYISIPCDTRPTDDFSDIMSYNRQIYHLNAAFQEKLGWLNGRIINITDKTGIFALSAIDSLVGAAALQLDSSYLYNGPFSYLVSHRKYLQYYPDAGGILTHHNHVKVFSNRIDAPNESHLLDMTPYEFTTSVLKQGQTLKTGPEGYTLGGVIKYITLISTDGQTALVAVANAPLIDLNISLNSLAPAPKSDLSSQAEKASTVYYSGNVKIKITPVSSSQQSIFNKIDTFKIYLSNGSLIATMTSSEGEVDFSRVSEGTQKFYVEGLNKGGFVGRSNEISINIDHTPPSVKITEPLNNATVKGTFKVKATATDSKSLTKKVGFYLDSSLLGEDTVSDAGNVYSYDLNSFLYSNDSHQLKVRAYDNAGNFSEHQIIISVRNNNPPVFDPIGDKTVKEGESLSFIVSATDADNDPLTYSAFPLPFLAGANFNETTGAFSWTPDYTKGTKDYSLIFSVTDNKSPLVSQTVKITVEDINRPPVLDHIPDYEINEGQLLTFTVSASDLDKDNLIYSFSNLPSGASFSGQTFSWTPAYGQARSYPWTIFSVTDNKSPLVSQIVKITVNNVTINSDFIGSPVSSNAPSTVSFTDQSFSLAGITGWNWDFGDGQTSDQQNPTHVYTAANTYTVSLTAIGPAGSSTAIKSNYIQVNESPIIDNPPVACIANPGQTVQAGTLVYLDGSCSSDPDHDPLSYLWTQTSGPSVALNNATTANPSFLAPEVGITRNEGRLTRVLASVFSVLDFFKNIFALDNSSTLEFELIVSANGKSDTEPAQVIVTSKPIPTHTLTVKKSGTGQGTITSNPSGLTCDASCNETSSFFNEGTKIKFEVIAESDSNFLGFSGGGCFGQKYTPVMGSDRTVIASFDKKPDNSSPIYIISPANDSVVKAKSNVSVIASVSSKEPVIRVEFYINGDKKGDDARYPYFYKWMVPKISPAAYEIQAKFYIQDPIKGQTLADESEIVTVRVE